ncbi:MULTISPECIES: BlaI/MecI/CopY family transcriptional regulator [unclassified Sphingopyxis]|jgi:BlaI family transcriptional regulator, penicillinase repressor|uniref:BlaI/MecI/CopY family transcriptional regulator n=1 Tax=unclassified Sphingopyxis TaxID=2614943 RepID=UPI00072FE879|nr:MULTISPECIES: BlaI/MecI/CopY family transcriptional regulator [unclassified Sphingopyxis]MBD3733720.1 BlaI/MecI/CopY family transcriptional regulator [Sphingopyxis sp.]KTE25156.1 CopY family transcriptional repressor [Sphingopyxis sp. H057]KTE53726.1 CopY family transcriptional repressor [Sphingopyxis sp. H073]KTE56318.1 CopY family transcriptional repressor [Sphingopyxis sp. H071]KTE62011.1 CopY family transcriptional repressor [Sphingopyxis sp. H107]
MAERASDSEMQVLSALWDEAPQTAADLTQRIGKINGWTQATVKTLLSRLVQKGAVTAEADGRRYLYSPAVERADAVGEESQRFVDRLFGGRVSPLIAHLAEREALSDTDIAEIEALLRKLKS